MRSGADTRSTLMVRYLPISRPHLAYISRTSPQAEQDVLAVQKMAAAAAEQAVLP